MVGGILKEKIRKQDDIGISGNVEIIVRNEYTGKIIRKERKKNRIPNTGLNYMRDLIRGENTNPISHFAVGTDGTSTTENDIDLGNEVYRQQITRIDVADRILTVRYFLSSNEANGEILSEAAILNSDEGGEMLGRVTYTDIEKNENISVTYIWDINLAYVE